MILFSDFDRTLFFRDEPEKTNTNIEAIRKWKNAGHDFCIATGRSYPSVTEETPAMKELCDYYIVDCGSILLDRSANILRSTSFEPEIVSRMLKTFEYFPETPFVVYFTQNSEEYSRPDADITKLQFWFKDTRLIPVATNALSLLPVFAFYSISSPDRPIEAGHRGFVEVSPKTAGKSDAINYLVQTRNYQPANIITVGDSENDISMINDYNGYMVKGSIIDQSGGNFKSTPSVAELVKSLLQY